MRRMSPPAYRKEQWAVLIFLLLLAGIFCPAGLMIAQEGNGLLPDTTYNRLETTSVLTVDSTLHVEVRNIDITKFPLVGVVFDVFDTKYNFIHGLTPDDIVIKENGERQKVLTLNLITRTNRVPIDFVFAIDQTGSMEDKITAIKQNIDAFTSRLAAKGIDYRLGLVVFDDNVQNRYWLTDDLKEFKGWIEAIETKGGGDQKENALEGIRAATGMNFRSSANRCVVLITDAPYHEYGGSGYGRTMYTPRTISVILNRLEMRTFCIVTPSIEGYHEIANETGGRVFDIGKPFAEILDEFVETMTSLYTATYRSQADLIPDSIQVELKLRNRHRASRKTFSVLEVGRKLVLENIHFATNKYSIEANSMPELDYLVRLMKARPGVKLKIEGHTDDVGDEDYNMKLSYMRAESVKKYMMKKGIGGERLFTIGYGESRPTAGNDTDDNRRLNRRTEFIIVQK